MLQLDRLNPQQYKGVVHDKGPLLLLAGAGSGKTRVITTRIAYLISEKHVSPRSILALTFTNKAAREMKERVDNILQKQMAKGLKVGTFHAFGVFILKKHIDMLGYRKRFSIFNTGDKIHLLTTIMKDLSIDIEALTPEDVSWQISHAKNNLVHYQNAAAFFEDSLLAEIYAYYQQTLKGFNIVDFDDLLLLPVQLFTDFPEMAEKYSKKYRYILVDEYQDTNQAQYSLLRCLTASHSNLCVVGDDDQSIYAWRGADISNILNFEKDFQGTEVIRLEQNYRSTGIILESANALIAHNSERKGKKLWTSGGQGQKIKVLSCTDERDEAENILGEIVSLKKEGGVCYGDMAVVFRTNFQTRPFEEMFAANGIPYEVIGGTRFFDRKEVKDILCYLRLLANRHDELALLRIINKPKRGIGPQTIEKIINFSQEHDLLLFEVLGAIERVPGIDGPVVYNIQTFHDMIDEFSKKIFKAGSMVPVVRELIQASGYEEELFRDAGGDANKYQKSLKYMQGVVNSIALFEQDEDVEEHDLFSYLARISLLTKEDTEEDTNKNRSVTLLTMHACKGLEFPHVFIAGVEEGNIPHSRSIESGEENIQEERRLFYVGMTRAMKGLTLSFTESRFRYGEQEACTPSRFLEEIPAEHLEFIDTEELNQLGEDDFMNALDQLAEKYSQ